MHTSTRIAIITLVCFGVQHDVAAQPQPAGEVEYARGAATAQREGQVPRIIGQGQRFYSGEVLSTSGKSFAVIRLDDGTRMTLRPETQFVVESINASKDKKASAVLRLFRGGIRALTGFISKVNSNGYQLHTPVATLGIRGTEFDARLCSGDCNDAAGDASSAAYTRARIVFSRGQISVRSATGAQKPGDTGVDIDSGDSIQSGSNGIAVLVFPDNSRITVQPRSEFVIRDYRFDERDPAAGKSLLELLRGGLRAVSGLIGKQARENYELRTPVATIGVRGTGFDLLCKNACSEPQAALQIPRTMLERFFASIITSAYAQSLPTNGMYAYVWSGKIELVQPKGRFTLAENHAAFIANTLSKPMTLPQVPSFLHDNPFPRPDNVTADPKELFAAGDRSSKQPGLYVSVYEGEVKVQDKLLKHGDASFTDPVANATRRLPQIPQFMRTDPFPRPADFKPSVYRLLDVIDKPQERFECEMQ